MSTSGGIVTNIHVGPAGWSYKDWTGIVYPREPGRGFDSLSFVGRYFDLVEVNSSFYRLPEARMVASWVRRTHDTSLRFTFKLTRSFTHERGDVAQADRDAYLQGIAPAVQAGKLGAILMQFPWSFRNTPEALEWIARLRDSFGQHPLVVEVRHASWDDPETRERLQRLGIGFCNIDQPRLRGCLGPTAYRTSPIAYFRFHGRRADKWFTENIQSHERYDYLYPEDELRPWVPRIREAGEGAEQVFVVANNHYRGQGPANALQLRALIEGHPVNVPDTLLKAFPQLESVSVKPAGQSSLFGEW
ncbi:MAG TPA: DUF72 domain-containing protein [Burkholderiales bacterium]|nr:DUF72 domain-containing protein [Burkholderiales bacterium]